MARSRDNSQGTDNTVSALTMLNWLRAAVLLLLLASLLAACAQPAAEEPAGSVEEPLEEEPEGEVSPAPEEEVVEEEEGITLDEIAEEPEAFFGQTVTVEGSVVEVANERAFFIVSDELVAADAMLVLTANEGVLETALTGDESVQVTGTVRQLVLPEIEDELGLELDPEIEDEFEDKPVIVATNVQVMTGAEEGSE